MLHKQLDSDPTQDATAMVNAYLARFSERAALRDDAGTAVVPKLDDSGYAQVQRGSATIGVRSVVSGG